MCIQKYSVTPKFFFVSLMAITLTGCETTLKDEDVNKDIGKEAMSGQEITKAFSGKTVQWYWQKETGTQTYHFDGSANATRSENRTKSGKWWVENDKSCRKWDDYNVGKTTCYQVIDKGENKFDLYLDGLFVYSEEIID